MKVVGELVSWIFTIIIFIFFLSSIGNGIMFLVQRPMIDPIDTGKAVNGIYAIKDDYSNMFLIEAADGKYIAIDAGRSSFGTKKGLKALDIQNEDVVAVFLTQSKIHHMAGLKQFQNAAVYANENAVYHKVKNKMYDGEVIEIAGVTIECIFTSGHVYDSVCYLVDNKYLFAGDTISLKGDKVNHFFKAYNGSKKKQAVEIQKLAALDGVEYIMTAHFGFTDRPEFPLK